MKKGAKIYFAVISVITIGVILYLIVKDKNKNVSSAYIDDDKPVENNVKTETITDPVTSKMVDLAQKLKSGLLSVKYNNDISSTPTIENKVIEVPEINKGIINTPRYF